jgi:tetratricopeptide (TPR) repeat protein
VSQLGYSRPVDGVVRRRMERVLPDVAPLVGVAQPGLALTPPVVQNSTLSQIGDVLNAGLAATARGIEFQAAMQDRAERQRRQAEVEQMRTEAGMAQIEQQFTKTREGEADIAAAQDIQVLIGQLERGEIATPQDFSPESQQEWAQSIADARSGGQGQIYQDRYRQQVTPRLLGALQDRVQKVAAATQADVVYGLQNRAITATADDFDSIRTEASALGVKANEFDARFVVPALQDAASRGDTQRIRDLQSVVSPSIRDVWTRSLQSAEMFQERQRSEVVSQQVTTAALNTSEALTSGRIEDILLQRERLREQMKSDPELARYYDGPIATLNNASERYFDEQAKEIQEARVANARNSTLGSFFAMTMQPGMGKADVLEANGIRVVDRGQVVATIPAAEVERTMKTAARAHFANEASRPKGESPAVAYSRWTQQNGYAMSEESSMMRIDARALKAAALAPTDERNRPTIQSAVGNFRLYRELRAAGTESQLGDFDGDMAVYENAMDILESNSLAGQQMTEEQAMIQAARFAAKPRPMQEAEREAVRNQAEKLLDRAPWIPFTRAEDSEVAKDNVSEFANILMMRNPNLRPVDAVKRAAEVVKAKSRIVNGHYTFFRDEIPDPGFGQDYSLEDAGGALAGILHEQIKDDTAYVWNNEKIGKGDIRLTQDPQSRMFAFVDNRTGDVLRYRHDDGAVTMTFTAEELKASMRSNATRKAMERRSDGNFIDDAMRRVGNVRFGGLE